MAVVVVAMVMSTAGYITVFNFGPRAGRAGAVVFLLGCHDARNVWDSSAVMEVVASKPKG
jgi:hypothetical protein